MKHFDLTEELAHQITGAEKEEQLYAALSHAAGRMGFDLFALAFDRRGVGDAASMLVHNYPDAWANVYVGFDLSGTDPIRRASERSLTGFQWRDVDRYIPLSRGDRQLLKVARESGIGDGYRRRICSANIMRISAPKTRRPAQARGRSAASVSTPRKAPPSVSMRAISS